MTDKDANAAPQSTAHGPKVRLKLAYDGTGFCGWQKQKHARLPSIQGTLETALSKIFNSPVTTIGSSRTDAGVHALGQVAHFVAPKPLEKYNLLRSLNALLPDEIVVREVAEAPDDFHALASSNGKTYRYLIHNSKLRNPLRRQTMSWIDRPLDIDYLNRATAQILGTHDFKSFQTAGTDLLHTVRTVAKGQWKRHPGHIVEFSIHGSGFLKQMVRNLVGTMLDLYFAGEPPEMMGEILKAQNRQKALGTAPAEGLYLVKVHYPTELDIRCRKL